MNQDYINLWEVIPEDKHSQIANRIWEALDDEGIALSQDAELSIRIYDEDAEKPLTTQEQIDYINSNLKEVN
tara:strand:+ start:4323 stop:4538 length:216 start_codon:yes stop_codon:yes gene_type:complete